MRCKKTTATEPLTRIVSKRNQVPMIKGICTFCGYKKNRSLRREAMSKNCG